jgi:hypothetical protein
MVVSLTCCRCGCSSASNHPHVATPCASTTTGTHAAVLRGPSYDQAEDRRHRSVRADQRTQEPFLLPPTAALQGRSDEPNQADQHDQDDDDPHV